MQSIFLLSILPLALAAPAQWTAPVIEPRGTAIIPGKYIVKIKDSANSTAVVGALNLLGGAEADHVYEGNSFRGFAGTLDAGTLSALQAHPDVEYIEKDAVYKINTYVTQTGATWGLGRISHKAQDTTTYVYDSTAGAGTCSYVIDTGIYTAHSQFGGRATFLANYADSTNDDLNGHGTHVAGTIGGTTYGVAKLTNLYAVKVLDADGSGTTSGVLAGMNYVTTDSKTRSCSNGAVANMSLGGGKSTALNAAAASMVSAGVFLAVAAGNNGANAANYSPSSEPTVCTVAAINNNDARPTWSNYGAVVDIFAPGVDVLSSWIGSTSATNTISGTSMATPHITGLGAYLLAFAGKKTPAALCTYIQSLANSDLISNPGTSTVNLIAFNGNPSG